MAQRPFYASGSATQIKQFPDNEFSNMLGRIGYLYGNSPVANLSVTLTGGNAGPVLTDTRYRSGTFAQTTGDQDAFDDGLLEYNTNPGAPELLSVATYDRLNRSINPPASLVTFDAAYYGNLNTKPVKWDASSNSFVEMTYLEVVDAFIDQWYEGQRQPSASNPASGGGYFVSSNVSETGATLQSTTPVFVDTVADASAYQSSLIGGAGVTFTTNNFNAATGSSSTSLYSSLIGGSGIQISFSNVSASGATTYGFGDFRYGAGRNSARPAGELLAYGSQKINHNGDPHLVISTEQRRLHVPDPIPHSRYKSYSHGHIVDGYPTTDDSTVFDTSGTSAFDIGRFYAQQSNETIGSTTKSEAEWGSLSSNAIGYDVEGADYLYLWAEGSQSAGPNDDGYIYIFLESSTPGDTIGVIFASGHTGNASTAQFASAGFTNHALYTGGWASASTSNQINGYSAAARVTLTDKVRKVFVYQFRHGGQPATVGYAFTKNVTAIANNATGFDIQTPVGTTRTAGSSWTLPFSNGNWSLAAGTWQTSTVVGASAQQSTVTFNAVSGNGTTANAALVSLGGAIDVNVTSLPGVTEEHIPPMTALSGGQFFNPNLHTNVNLTYLVDISVADIDQATRTANYANYGYRIAATYTIQQSDVGAALGFLPLDPAQSSDDGGYGNTVNRIVSGPFRFGHVSGSGLPGGASLHRYNYIASGGGRVFAHNGGTNDPFGYDADGFRFFSIRPQDVGKTVVYAVQAQWVGTQPHSGVIDAQGQLQSGRYKGLSPEDSYFIGTGGGYYAGNVFNHPRIRIVKATDPNASNRFTATAQNNTGYDIQTPVGTTRLSGSSWNLTNNAATNAWTIAAGSYLQTTGTDTYQDHFITTNYYLHQMDLQMQTQGSGYKTPLVVDYDTNGDAKGLRAMTYQEFDDFFEPLVKYVTSNLQGYRLNYNIDGNGDNIGDPILNKQMVGVTGQLATRFVNVNDYRSQMFPNGVVVAQNTHRLKLEKY